MAMGPLGCRGEGVAAGNMWFVDHIRFCRRRRMKKKRKKEGKMTFEWF